MKVARLFNPNFSGKKLRSGAEAIRIIEATGDSLKVELRNNDTVRATLHAYPHKRNNAVVRFLPAGERMELQRTINQLPGTLPEFLEARGGKAFPDDHADADANANTSYRTMISALRFLVKRANME